MKECHQNAICKGVSNRQTSNALSECEIEERRTYDKRCETRDSSLASNLKNKNNWIKTVIGRYFSILMIRPFLKRITLGSTFELMHWFLF